MQFGNLETIAVFPADEILRFAVLPKHRKTFVINGISYKVNMSYEKYIMFIKNKTCVCCGVKGEYMVLQKKPSDISPHFNLYGLKNGKHVLMTKDHIIPKSKGGKNGFYNLRTMCEICNSVRGNEYLTMDQLLEKVERLYGFECCSKVA